MTKSEYINLKEYEVISRIGEGSFAEVFTIRNKLSNQIYAAKISLKSTHSLHGRDKKTMNREIKIISCLDY